MPLSFFAARRAETRADRYTLEVMEDDDAITSMIQTIIFQHFLREQYWPLVMNQPRDGKHRLFPAIQENEPDHAKKRKGLRI